MKYLRYLFLLIVFLWLVSFIKRQLFPLPTDCIGLTPLVNANSYPEGVVIEVLSPLPDGTKDSSGSTVYLGRGIAIQDVYPYQSERGAIREFALYYREPVFSSSSPNERWQVPSQFADFESQADDFALGCGLEHNLPMCRMIARYKNYFVLYNSYIYPGEMTYSDLKKVVEDIEKRMLSCINVEE